MKWISVKDRLPEVGKRVLTLDKWGHIRDRNLYQFRSGHLNFSPDGLKPGEDISHWMPLPEGPMEVGKDMNVLTNADRIRSMTDEELADFLCGIAYTGREPWSEPFARAHCDKCPTVKGRYADTGEDGEWHECEFDDGKCPHGSDCVWWLQQPVKEE